MSPTAEPNALQVVLDLGLLVGLDALISLQKAVLTSQDR